MGRHARGASRSHVRVNAGAVVGLVIVVLAVGSWLGSRTDSAANSVSDEGTVTASAVVVSSLACVGGAGQTLVDVVPPAGSGSAATPVRATLNGCGFQEGQQLSVQYRQAEPAKVTLADTGGGTGSGALLPLGLTVAGLLAVGAALAVYVDGRPSRRRRHAADPAGRLPEDGGAELGDPASGSAAAEPPDRAWVRTDATDAEAAGNPLSGDTAEDDVPTVGGSGPQRADRGSARATGDTAVTGWDLFAPDAFPADSRSMQYPDHNGHGPFTAAQARTTSPVDTADDLLLPDVASGSDVASDPASIFPWVVDGGRRRREISSVDMVFPSSSAELAASLHDELFTHRTSAG